MCFGYGFFLVYCVMCVLDVCLVSFSVFIVVWLFYFLVLYFFGGLWCVMWCFFWVGFSFLLVSFF